VESRESLLKNRKLGADPSKWLWGNASPAQFDHPLAAAPLIGGRFKVEYNNVNGNGQTPNVGDSVSMRLIAKPSDWDQTRHVIPLGQSGNNNSPHWKDQFESWRTGKPAVFPFSKSAVSAAAKNRLILSPVSGQ
jgi:penicillin amidase